MPRFIAVKCASCDLYQSIQEPKNQKWVCRVCNAKNSVVRVFAVSEQAKDIRGIVQQYNMERGKAAEQVQAQRAAKRAVELLTAEEDAPSATVADIYASLDPATKGRNPIPQPSGEKWATLLDEVDEHHSADEGDDLTAQGFLTSLPSKEIEGKKKRRTQSSTVRPRGGTTDEKAQDIPPEIKPSAATTHTTPRDPQPTQRAPPSAPRTVLAAAPRAPPAAAHRVVSTPIPPSPSAFPAFQSKGAARSAPQAQQAQAGMQQQKVGPSVALPLRKPPPAAASNSQSAKWGDLLPTDENSNEEGGNDDGLVFAKRDEEAV